MFALKTLMITGYLKKLKNKFNKIMTQENKKSMKTYKLKAHPP